MIQEGYYEEMDECSVRTENICIPFNRMMPLHIVVDTNTREEVDKACEQWITAFHESHEMVGLACRELLLDV